MPVLLGTEKKWTGSGSKRTYAEVRNEMMYIPILSTIQSLMKDDDFVKQVWVPNLCAWFMWVLSVGGGEKMRPWMY